MSPTVIGARRFIQQNACEAGQVEPMARTPISGSRARLVYDAMTLGTGSGSTAATPAVPATNLDERRDSIVRP